MGTVYRYASSSRYISNVERVFCHLVLEYGTRGHGMLLDYNRLVITACLTSTSVILCITVYPAAPPLYYLILMLCMVLQFKFMQVGSRQT